MQFPDFKYELQCFEKGYSLIAGCDEAGRGPSAGPVVAAAVVVPDGWSLDGLNDSKKLTSSKRESLVEAIHATRIAWAVGIATVEEIDRINILQATFLAMRRALDGLGNVPSSVVVDGNLVTSRGMGCSVEFGLRLVELLVSKAKADEIARAIVHPPPR